MTVFKRVMEETPGDGGIYGVMWSQWKSIGPLGINLLSFAQHKNAVCKHIFYLFPYLTDFFFFLSPLAGAQLSRSLITDLLCPEGAELEIQRFSVPALITHSGDGSAKELDFFCFFSACVCVCVCDERNSWWHGRPHQQISIGGAA